MIAYYAGLAADALGRTDEALRLYEIAGKDTAQSGISHVCLAQMALSRGDFESAEVHGSDAVSKLPDDSLAHRLYARALQKRGKLDAALAHFQTALELEHDVSWRIQDSIDAGYVLGQLKRFEEAEDLFRSIISTVPDNAEAHGYLGDALFEQDKKEEAIEEHRKAAALQPDNGKHWKGIADCAYQLQQLDTALDALTRLSELEQPLSERRSPFLGMQDRIQEAEAVCQENVNRMPDCVDLWFNWGIARMAQSDFPDAERKFRHVLTLQPEHPVAKPSIGLARRGARYMNHLQAIIEELAVDRTPDRLVGFAECAFEVALVIIRNSERYALPYLMESYQTVLEVVKAGTDTLAAGQALSLLAVCQWTQGSYEGAKKSMAAALSAAPQDSLVRYESARIMAQTGETDRATKVLRQLTPDHADHVTDATTDILLMPLLEVSEFRQWLVDVFFTEGIDPYTPCGHVMLLQSMGDRQQEG